MTETTRVTEKGQATIPKPIREKYDLEPGDEVVWIDTDDGIVVRKASRRSARGMLVPDGTSAEARERIAEALERRVEDHRRDLEQRWTRGNRWPSSSRMPLACSDTSSMRSLRRPIGRSPGPRMAST